MLFSVTVAAAHIFVLKMAQKANLEPQKHGRAFGPNVDVSAIRLTNALSSAGGKITATILQAGIA